MEADALAVWAGTDAAIALLAADLEAAALLLQRLQPGTHLPPGDDSTAIVTAAALLARLHSAGTTSGFPSLLEAYEDYERRVRAAAEWEQRQLAKPQPIGLSRLPIARAAAQRLCATTPKAVLLHGDFIDKNLLWDGSRYVAIDPTPRVGDPCSDIGFFAAYHPPGTGIIDRASAVADRMGQNPDRAVRWAAVWAVGEACETWRYDSDDLQTVVSSDEFGGLLQT